MSDTHFDLADFLEPEIREDVCLICALPLSERKRIELEVYDGADKKKLANSLGLQVQDLDHHFRYCIAERDSSIPRGVLMNQLLSQITAFITELEQFRVYVNGERNPESLKTYAMMFRELRQTVESINKQSSPDYTANMVKNLVLRPIILSMAKSKIDKLGELRGSVISQMPESQRDSVDAAFTDCAKSWGLHASAQQKQFILKLAEIFGIDSNHLT